ncbi:hypothetical protein NQZ68_031596 [Dissostichus eleginoides]|nr:hypothetical protein NQZ68_031596 [Dissostichus eleginoides]
MELRQRDSGCLQAFGQGKPPRVIVCSGNVSKSDNDACKQKDSCSNLTAAPSPRND